MTRLNSKIAALTLLLAIGFGASTANAGIIINSFEDDAPQCSETNVKDGIIINSITGIIINSLTGIIINSVTSTECTDVRDGIIINS